MLSALQCFDMYDYVLRPFGFGVFGCLGVVGLRQEANSTRTS